MAATVVQSSGPGAGAGAASTYTRTIVGATAGNLLAAVVSRIGGTPRTLALSDDKSNTWVSVIDDAQASGSATPEVEIGYANNIASGDTVVTITASGTTGLYMNVYEVTGQDTTTQPDTSDQFDTTVSGTTWHCAASGNVDSSADSVSFMALSLNGTGGTITYPGGWTCGAFLTSQAHYGHIEGQVTNDRATVTGTNSRVGIGGIMSIKAAGGATASPKGIFGLPLDGPFRRAVY